MLAVLPRCFCRVFQFRMGADQSVPEDQAAPPGFRVIYVYQGGPAGEAGLEMFFDRIVEVDDNPVEPDQRSFFHHIQRCEGKKTNLRVYNSLTRYFRDVSVFPRRWSGAGVLGATVRYEEDDEMDSQGLRVLEVFPSSPASLAGLIPETDFLLGSKDMFFRDYEDLSEAVSHFVNKELTLYVYNSQAESTREVTLTPQEWGGPGVLGCDVGSGLLHRIPQAKSDARMGERKEPNEDRVSGRRVDAPPSLVPPVPPPPPFPSTQETQTVGTNPTPTPSAPPPPPTPPGSFFPPKLDGGILPHSEKDPEPPLSPLETQNASSPLKVQEKVMATLPGTPSPSSAKSDGQKAPSSPSKPSMADFLNFQARMGGRPIPGIISDEY